MVNDSNAMQAYQIIKISPAQHSGCSYVLALGRHPSAPGAECLFTVDNMQSWSWKVDLLVIPTKTVYWRNQFWSMVTMIIDSSNHPSCAIIAEYRIDLWFKAVDLWLDVKSLRDN